MKRAFLLATVLAGSSLATTQAVFAATPATNDLWADATTVASLPFTETIDTTAATTDADDAEANDTFKCGAPATDASVWYAYTPAANEIVIAETFGSSYSSGFIVVAGQPGSFSFVGCGQASMAFFAEAGVTYSMVAIDDQLDEDGLNGGDLVVNIYNAPPPPSIEITVDPTGRFNRDGSATVSGTVTCTGSAEFTALDVYVSQRVGRINISGWGGTYFDCDGATHSWSATVHSDNGLFKGGKAANVTIAYACGWDCSEAIVQKTIFLKK